MYRGIMYTYGITCEFDEYKRPRENIITETKLKIKQRLIFKTISLCYSYIIIQEYFSVFQIY